MYNVRGESLRLSDRFIAWDLNIALAIPMVGHNHQWWYFSSLGLVFFSRDTVNTRSNYQYSGSQIKGKSKGVGVPHYSACRILFSVRHTTPSSIGPDVFESRDSLVQPLQSKSLLLCVQDVKNSHLSVQFDKRNLGF